MCSLLWLQGCLCVLAGWKASVLDVVRKEFSTRLHHLYGRPAAVLHENLRGYHEKKHWSGLGKMSSGSWFVLYAGPSAATSSAFCPAGGLHCPCTGSPVTEPGAARTNTDFCSIYLLVFIII